MSRKYCFSLLKDDLSMILEECYSEMTKGFIIFGCPTSTDIDLAVIVNSENQHNGQVLPLSSKSQQQLEKRLAAIGVDMEKKLDITLIYVDEKKNVIGFSKGGQETVKIIFSTWRYHPQEYEGDIPAALNYIKDLTDEQMKDLFPGKVKETSRWPLKRLKEIISPEDYLNCRKEKNTALADQGNSSMVFFIEISSHVIVHPSNLGNLDIVKWRNNMKSMVMKLIQVVLWFEFEETCYLKQELAERCVPMIFSDSLGETKENSSMVQEGLYYLTRGNCGYLPESPILFEKLIQKYEQVVSSVFVDKSINMVISDFSRFSSNLGRLGIFLPQFLSNPVDFLPSFEKEWNDDDMNLFEMPSVTVEDFEEKVVGMLSTEQISYLKEHFIFLNQRSEEWHYYHQFYDCGNSTKVSMKGFRSKYNFIRGNFIEMMVQYYIDEIFSELGLENIFAFTLGFVVEKIGVENKPGAAPDLLVLTQDGILYIVEIKGLKSLRQNKDFYRGYSLAKKQTECVERILDASIIQMKKLIILGSIQDQNLHLKLF